jgi:hypothetical protein
LVGSGLVASFPVRQAACRLIDFRSDTSDEQATILLNRGKLAIADAFVFVGRGKLDAIPGAKFLHD